MTNVDVRAEKFVDVSAGSALLQNVVAVLATPNNTYSGVTDPVDLACGRGGDLAMLEVLTDTEDGTLVRVTAVLEEQRQTLRLSMSRPQVSSFRTRFTYRFENSTEVIRRDDLLACDDMWTRGRVPNFRHRRWRQYVRPKHWFPPKLPRNITTQKTNTAVRTANLKIKVVT